MENSSEHIIEQLVEALGELRSSIAQVEEKLMLLASRNEGQPAGSGLESVNEPSSEQEEDVTAFDLSFDESDSIAAAAVAEAAFAIYGESAHNQPFIEGDDAAGNGEDSPEEENALTEDPSAPEAETEIVAEIGDDAGLEINVPAETVEEEVETEAAEAEIADAEEEETEAVETEVEEIEVPAEEEVAEEMETEAGEVEIEVEAGTGIEEEDRAEAEEDFGFFAPLEDPVSTPAKECINDEAAASIKPALMDVLLGKHAWKTDVPGPQVHNILSAISLNDRVLFINTLFGSDPLLFQETVSHLNSLENFTDAERFISSNFNGWKFDSEPVYRFMMAIRRKLG